jgi:CAAX protease family protein
MNRRGSQWLDVAYGLAYLAIYATFLILLNRLEGFSLTEPLLILSVVGIGFSSAAWWLTRQSVPLAFTVKHPAGESALLLCYLAVLAAYLAGGRRWITFSAEPLLSILILAVKLILFVLVPILLLRAFWRYRVRDLLVITREACRHTTTAIVMSLVLIAFQLAFGRGLADIRHSQLPLSAFVLGTPLVYLFLLIEVGLVEEFFFRVLLQSRLAAWMKSEVGGIVAMSLLFGLAHAPGLYYRTGATQEGLGPHPPLLLAVGYSIVMLSVTGFFLGVLWIRTRNLLLVMAVHAAGDLLPNLVPTLRNWL